jgi:hypothetical protein
VSKETISRITDRVLEEMNEWAARPLDAVYAAIFIDAIVVKVRDGQVGDRPFCAAIGVTLAGEKDVLGLWAGTGGEGAKFWMAVLTDLRNRRINRRRRAPHGQLFAFTTGLSGGPFQLARANYECYLRSRTRTCVVNASFRGPDQSWARPRETGGGPTFAVSAAQGHLGRSSRRQLGHHGCTKNGSPSP